MSDICVMDGDRLDRVQEVFDRAQRLAAGQRDAFLQEACDNETMRREVESLLARASTAGTAELYLGQMTEQPTGPMIAERYEVIEKLGEGGMGAVFKVRDHKVGRRLIALKRILKLDDRARERFQSEIDSAANLSHRNICKVHDRGEDEHGPFFTMELLNGGSLRDRVETRGPLSDEELVDLARQLSQALRYAHRKSVQHRDIKPGNVLFAEDGDPKLADFGLARAGPASGLSVTNFGLGTPGFSAPEQLRNAKAADHRADIYSLGATLYYALTGKAPHAVIEPSEIRPFWRPLILKCMKEDPSERFFDAEGILDYLEKSPAGSGVDVADRCNVCGVANPAGSSFCRQCGAGLNEPCPACRVPNPSGQKTCRNCGVDVSRRWASDKWLAEARTHLERRQYHRAEKAATEALAHEPGRTDAQVVQAEAHDMLQQLGSLRRTATDLEQARRYDEAQQTWRQLLEIHPEHSEAIEALERIRRTLILNLKDAFEEALSRRTRKGARAVIGRLNELQVDQAEVNTLLDRLKSADRWWRRRRIARRIVAGLVTLVVLAGGYMLVAEGYNRNLESRAALAMSRGETPALERFLPSWPRDARVTLSRRAKVCAALDGRYGSSAWRAQVRPVKLFGGRRTDEQLITQYNWVVLRQIADGALAGSDEDLQQARDLVRKIAWEELGPAGGPFKRRQVVLGNILAGWYDGALSLAVFADPDLAGDPELELVAEHGKRITDPASDCLTIETSARLLTRLGRGTDIPEQVRAHHERIFEALGESVDDPRSGKVDDLLSRICVDPDDADSARYLAQTAGALVADLQERALADPLQRPDVLALLVAIDRGMPDPPAQLKATVRRLTELADAQLFPEIDQAFAAGAEVGGALAKLRELSEYWPYLDEPAADFGELSQAAALRQRHRMLREVAAHWQGGALSVTPLCHLDGTRQPPELWDEFTLRTQQQAIDAFRRRDLDRAAELAALLRDLDHTSEAMGDLQSRFDIHRVLTGLDGTLPGPLQEQLALRLFEDDPAGGEATAGLATDIAVAAIEAGAFDAAVQLAPTGDDPRLEKVARNLGQLGDLPQATLLELEAGVLSDPRLPRAARMLAGEVETRLGQCFPDPATLQSPGQLSLGSAHELSKVTIGLADKRTIELAPLQGAGNVYRVPFLESGPVTLTLRDPFDVQASRPVGVAHSRLRNPADVTFDDPRVVVGKPAVLVIRPRLDFERVRVEDRQLGDLLIDHGDHWTLELPTALDPDQPAADLRWAVRLVTGEGVQNVELPLTVVATEVVAAEDALKRGAYEEVFDRIGRYASHDHQAVRHLVHEAGDRWLQRLRAAAPQTWVDADALVEECRRFRSKVPQALQQDVSAIHDLAWTRRIDLTTTWPSVAALQADLAFLDGLEHPGDDQKRMAAWLRGAASWAGPIVSHMQRRPGDWSTVSDPDLSAYPAMLIHRTTGLEFAYVPQGSFAIGGSSRSPQETPHRDVTVTGFYLSRTECTNQAWETAPDGSSTSSTWVRDPRLPATGIFFDEAVAWCRRRGLDLPTEAQWELAAGGPDSQDYPWGRGDCQPNVKRLFRSSAVAEVGSFECDQSPYGIMDMAGNVREWCHPVSNATYRIVIDGAQDPPARSDGVVQRGASYLVGKKEGKTHCRLFVPGGPSEVGVADDDVGFRPVLAR